VVEEDPKLIAARATLITLLVDNNQFDSAASYVESGLQIMPNTVELIELKAKLLLLKHHTEEALRVLQNMSPPITQEPEYYALLASTQQQLGHLENAEQTYKQLLELDHNNANWLVGMGLALESQKKNNAALQAYQQAFALGSLSRSLQATVQEKIAKLGG
jgi:MSHA biogenesis protein MshN